MIKNFMLAVLSIVVGLLFYECSRTTTRAWVVNENGNLIVSNSDSLNKLKKSTLVSNSDNASFEEFRYSKNISDLTGWQYNGADNGGFELIPRQKNIDKKLKKNESLHKRNERKRKK